MKSRQGVNRLQLVRWEFDIAWAALDVHLDQLTDAECLWEPTTPCWNVRRGPKGGWQADWQVPMPEPLPVTTIGWRTWHLGSWWSHVLTATFAEPEPPGSGRAHVPQARTAGHDQPGAPPTTAWPGDAELTAQWLRRLHVRWLRALGGLDEHELDTFDRSIWMQRGTKPLAHLLVWVNSEITRSAAEIGLLRTLHATAG